MTSRIVLLGLALAFAATTPACVKIQTRPTREFLLSWHGEIPPDFQRGAATKPRGQSIAIGPIVTATYLQRAGIVTRRSDNRIDASTVNTWGEPLEAGIARMLVEAVAVETDVNRIARMPWPFPGAPDLRIAVEIINFEYEYPTDAIQLVARWTLLDGSRGRAWLVRREILTVEIDDDDIDSIVAGMSKSVLDLGRVIAEDVAKLEEMQAAEAEAAEAAEAAEPAQAPPAPL
jgi:uncharacterized lipoprotein YmbA